MGSALRKTGRYSAWALVVLAAVVGLALLVLQTRWAKDRLRQELVERANVALRGELSAERLSGSLLWSATLEGVALKDGRGRPLARVRRAHVDYALLSLLWGELEIGGVEIDDPRILLRRYEDGTLNVATLAAAKQPEPPVEPSDFTIDVEDYELNGGTLVWVDRVRVARQHGRGDIFAPAIERIVEARTSSDDGSRTEPLRRELEELDSDPRTTPGLALVDGLDLRGSIQLTGATEIRAVVDRLHTRIDVDTLGRPLRPSLRGLRATYAPDRVELSLESFELASDLRIGDVSAQSRLQTDASGSVRPGPYVARVGELRVEPSLANEFLPEGSLAVDVTTELAVGGDLERTWFRTKTHLGDAGTLETAGRGGLVEGTPHYDAAVRISELAAQRVGRFGQPPATVNAAAALHGEGIDPRTAEANLSAAVWESSVSSVRIRTMYAKAELADGAATLRDFALDSSHLVARARGEAGLDGTYSLEARTRTPRREMSTEELGLEGMPEVEVGQADLELLAEGRLETNAENPIDAIDRTRIRATWHLTEIDGFGVRVGSSRGDIDLRVGSGSAESGTRRRKFDVRAETNGDAIRLPGLSVGSFRLDGRADGRLRRDPSGASPGLGALSSDWSGRASAVAVGDVRLDELDFDASVRPTSGPDRYRATTNLGLAGLSTGELDIGSIRSDLEGTASLSGGGVPTLGRFSMEGTTRLKTLQGASISLASVETNLDLSGSPADPNGTVDTKLESLRLADRAFPSGGVEIRAESGRSISLSAELTPEQSPDRPYRTSLSTVYARQLDAVTLEELRLGRPGQMWNLTRRASVTLLPGGVRISEFELENGDQRIFIDGTYRSRGSQSLEVELERISLEGLRDLADLRPLPGLAGTVGAEVQLAGTSSDPTVDLSARGRNLSALAYGPGSFEIEARSDAARVVLEKMLAGIADRNLVEASARLPIDWDLSGAWSFDRTSETRIDAELSTVSIEELKSAAPDLDRLPLDGSFGGHLKLRGTPEDPRMDAAFRAEKFSVHGDVAGVRIDIDDVDSKTELLYGGPVDPDAPDRQHIEFTSNLQWRQTRVVDVEFETDAPLVEWGLEYVDGELAADALAYRVATEPLHFRLVFEKTSLREIPLEPLKAADAEGVLSGSVTVDGTLLQPEAKARLDLDDFGWNQYRDVFVTTRLRTDDEKIELEIFRLEWDADEVVSARGTLPFPVADLVEGRPVESLPLDFKVQLRKTPLAKFGAVDNAFNRFRGSVAGYVKLDGTLTSPQIDTRVAIIDAFFDQTTPSTVGVWVHADERGAEGGTMFCRQDQPILTGTFDLPLNLDVTALASGAELLRDGPIEARLQGKNVPIEQLVPTPLVDEWITDTEGYLQIDLKVAGTWERPEPTGLIALEDGGVTLVDFGRRFKNIQMRTELSREEIVLERLKLEDNRRGEVEIDGGLELSNFSPESFAMDVRTKSFDAGQLAADISALVTSKVEIGGTFGDRYDIDVDVAELTVELPENQKSGTHPTTLSTDIAVVDRRGTEEQNRLDEFLASGSTGAEVLNARIDIDVSRDSYIRHPNGFLRFKANLQAKIQGPRFLLNGNVDSIKGDFEFLGRDFRVDRKEGIVRFTGAHPPNPQLDVVAIHPLDRTVVAQLDPPARETPKVFVRVTGTAREPKLELTSEPTMSESEIIFVLMTGRPPSNADVGQEEGVASQAAAAAGGIFSALIQQKISKTVPVDVFRFESGESGLQGSQVRVGKYITSDLFVSSSYKFAEDDREGGWQTRVEYHFLPRWMVEAVYGENQTGALNVFWDIY